MAAATAVRDSSVGRRIRRLKELVQHVNGIIQIIVVRLANGDMEFTSNPGAKHSPILLEDKMKIVPLPMFDGRFVDDAVLECHKATGRPSVPRGPYVAFHAPHC